MHEIDKIEYSRGCSHIGTCWIQNCWQSQSRICLTSFHSSTLLLQKIISSFKVFCTGMHEIDKIEYSRGVLWIFYINILSCGVFSEWEADGNFLTRVSGSEKYSIFRPVGIYILYIYVYIHNIHMYIYIQYIYIHTIYICIYIYTIYIYNIYIHIIYIYGQTPCVARRFTGTFPACCWWWWWLKIFNGCKRLTELGELNPYWRSSMTVRV